MKEHNIKNEEDHKIDEIPPEFTGYQRPEEIGFWQSNILKNVTLPLE
jgi:hypothetical protein